MDNALNNIVLNSTMLENLYGHSLVEIGESGPPPKLPLKYLGNNVMKVTVLVNDQNHAFLPEDQLSFLSRILLACRMNTGDVAILNMANGATIAEIMTQLDPEKIIAFGVSIDPQIPVFSIGRFNRSSLLQIPGLDDLVNETDEGKILKGKLWNCLKNLFSIS